MPFYDYKCSCGWEEEDVFRHIAERHIKCSECKRKLTPNIISSLPPADHTFQEQYYEHLGPNGTLVSSKQQLKEESIKNNLYSYHLEG